MAASNPTDVAGVRRRLSALRHQRMATAGTNIERVKAPDNDDAKGNYSEELVNLDGDDDGVSSPTQSYTSASSSNHEEDGANVPAEEMRRDRFHARNGNVGVVGRSDRADTYRVPSKENVGNGTYKQRRAGIVRKEPTDPEPESSRWFGYDLSIIVALVSPIGNLLTGGDHIKNILLLFLLIYYLHQLVEVPWMLYRESIPRKDPQAGTEDEDADENALSRAARAELHTLELFYLTLTVLSPFLGASLLRYVSTAITGDAATLSWFSTSLFVLATGIRPWTHLVERLKSRSRALKDLLRDEDGSGAHTTSAVADSEGDIAELREYMHALDTRLLRLSEHASGETKEVYAHLQDVVEGVDKTLRRHRTELAKTAQAQDARLAVLETRLHGLDLAVERSRLFLEGPGSDAYNFGGSGPRAAWRWFKTVCSTTWVYALHAAGFRQQPPSRRLRRRLMGPSRMNGLSSQRRKSLEPIAEEDAASAAGAESTTDEPPIHVNGGTGSAANAANVSRRSKHGGWLSRSVALAGKIAFAPFALTVRACGLVVALPYYFVRVLFS